MIPRISRNAVKEGFDTLPAAICYFDRNGLLRLINHRMRKSPQSSVAGICRPLRIWSRRCAVPAAVCGCAMRPPASTNSRTERYIISRCALFRTNTVYRTPR